MSLYDILVSGIAAVAVACFIYAVLWRAGKINETRRRKIANSIIVGAWTLLPPSSFWMEWHWSKLTAGSADWVRMVDGFDVSRNVWLAFVVVLAALFKIKWIGGE